MDLESIHELPEDEIQSILDDTWGRIKFIYTNPSMKPEKTRGQIESQIDHNLDLLVRSIKKSILCIYPKQKENLSEVIDANEALYFQQSLEQSRIIPTPLYEGITALVKLYFILDDYKIDYRAEEAPAILSDFQEMERAIKKYISIAIGPTVKLGAKRRHEQKKNREKRRTWKGLTHEEIKTRNMKIKEQYETSKLNQSSFTEKHAKEYHLKPRQMRNILNSDIGN